ncbi:hypothetical protein BCT63_15700 [Vibrio kanaloae]|jgi:hypothetical protein|uniref:Uncharacterized protein n=1 Tax=Vibrio kanaloae TaxID=170673 RepID=A0A2N7J9F0_9VIBR|nr:MULTISPECIES: hypothetical protein [Vibrio]MCG9556101.1 hypothetical protein [Vibrio kanaloae]NOJ00449.1 hypothetical protein [Vibrio kanaloae]PMM02926.1 hypothetical protein BCT63_15700 [Vibrio kanaloae]TKF22416.1 hypothetical protein FCV52_19990 [Vibrio kanaloae]UIJ40766.1 hypothetical protein LWM38_13855 [Vibrio kanaloae]
MAKRFCKLNRRDITEHLGEIHSLVTEPKFVCRSCARSSADQANLCKPTAIPPLGCQSKPIEEKVVCGLLAETLPKPEITLVEVVDTPDSAVQMFDPSVAKKPSLKKAKLKKIMASNGQKKELKRAKKAAKKQEKYNKKLAKVIKKQQKLFKKSQKMESKLERINLQLDDVVFTESQSLVANHIH